MVRAAATWAALNYILTDPGSILLQELFVFDFLINSINLINLKKALWKESMQTYAVTTS